GLSIDAVGVNHARVDAGGLDDRTLGGEVALREGDGRSETFGLRARRGHDDVVGVDAIAIREKGAAALAPLRGLPPIEDLAEGAAGDGSYVGVEQAQVAEVKHHLG